VIERILRHCGQWEGPIRTNAGPRAPPDGSHRVSAELPDPRFVPDPEYLESESRESESRKFRADATRELQLVLDPDFL
jgi:hypothetical protein